jgi:hypothetical protein
MVRSSDDAAAAASFHAAGCNLIANVSVAQRNALVSGSWATASIFYMHIFLCRHMCHAFPLSFPPILQLL